MPKFRVAVTCIVERTYTVEVDESTEDKAEQAAAGRWRDEIEFDVDKPDSWKFEAEQLTAECPGCGVEHVIPYNDLRVCHCSQFIADPDLVTDDKLHRFAHLVVNDVCVPAPWWWEDQDYCAACGKLEEEKERKNA